MTNNSSPRSTVRIRRPSAGIGIAAISMAMALSVDSGFTRAWPEWGRATWAFVLLLGILVAVALVVNGMGIVTSESLAASSTADQSERGRVLSAKTFFAVYAGSLVLMVAIALWLERTYGISGEQSIAAIGGALFLLAGSGRPWWLYYTFRRLGWFAAIENDTTMRLILGVIGAGLLLVTYLAR